MAHEAREGLVGAPRQAERLPGNNGPRQQQPPVPLGPASAATSPDPPAAASRALLYRAYHCCPQCHLHTPPGAPGPPALASGTGQGLHAAGPPAAEADPAAGLQEEQARPELADRVTDGRQS